MANILYVSCGMSSALHAALELSRRLTAAGHGVCFLSHADIEQAVRAQGFDFVRLCGDRELEGRLEPLRSIVGDGLTRAPRRALEWLAQRRRLRELAVESDEIERAVAELDPDLLILDIEMHYAIVATANLGIPTALAIVWFNIFRDPAGPPLHSSRGPARSWGARLRNRLAWGGSYAAMLASEQKRRFSAWGLRKLLAPFAYDTLWIGDLQAAAGARGFDLATQTSRTDWLRPLVYTRLPILSFNAAEMDFTQRRPANLHYVGPMVNAERRESRMSADERARFDVLAKRRRSGDPSRPLVYCSLGTFWATDQRFLESVLAVFDRRREWDLILGLGGKLAPASLGVAPANALVLEWAPQIEALALADCAITHGGIGSINECIAMGVPMVVYSTRHVDQNGCAARVAHHGLGVLGDKDRDDIEAIERNVDKALSDPTYRENVAAMRDVVERYRRPDRALEVIEGLLAPRASRPGPRG